MICLAFWLHQLRWSEARPDDAPHLTTRCSACLADHDFVLPERFMAILAGATSHDIKFESLWMSFKNQTRSGRFVLFNGCLRVLFTAMPAAAWRAVPLRFRSKSHSAGNRANRSISVACFQMMDAIRCRVMNVISFPGPPVEVGVTMYVLSISSLSEVQMVPS